MDEDYCCMWIVGIIFVMIYLMWSDGKVKHDAQTNEIHHDGKRR